MASSSALFLAMLFISAMSAANSLLVIQGITIKAVTFEGQVLCEVPSSTTPPPPPAPQPVAGVNVVVVCDGSRTAVTRVVTDANGFFQRTVDTSSVVLSNPGSCDAIVRFPEGRCVYSPTATTLTSVFEFVEVVQGGIVVFRASSFSV